MLLGISLGLGFAFSPGPLSRKSVTEISLVDKNMPAYTLFVQTNRRATVNGVESVVLEVFLGSPKERRGNAGGPEKFAWELR